MRQIKANIANINGIDFGIHNVNCIQWSRNGIYKIWVDNNDCYDPTLAGLTMFTWDKERQLFVVGNLKATIME